jgi:CspA family cold shock protein
MTSRGTIKFYNEGRGFGFIQADSGPDVFFHGTQLRDDGIGTVSPGDPVAYECVMQRKNGRLRATKIALVQ